MSDAEQNQTAAIENSVIEKEPVTTEQTSDDVVDQELEAMKARVQEMESEAAKLRDMQAEVEKSMFPAQQEEDKETIDSRSVYVGQVDYGASPEELQAHFQSCGTINRVTILCDKFTGHPKGYAYIEFAESSFVNNAVSLNESLFRGRLLKVTPKRTNVPGFAARGRGRGRGRGAYGGYAPGPYYGHTPSYGYRGRGRGRGMYYAPY
ncbi:RNA-binding domain-containing protein [Hesseltinella vesiculosa]|uniref:RNA-binding domain-containing protein n=1 Tax=Hesseltinella vesiculosa TaxID=101127 RepID=A0A1X2GEA8_9FUNG|nr:RNA-binding domain-containing protein [Hesseltinella vesiculosa]